MSRALALGLLSITFILRTVSADDSEFVNCNCDDENTGFWTVHNIIECQRVSDFLICAAYFSIPIELLYFVSCSNFPFKWVFLQFIAFIVLCGLTHLLNGWTYYGPHSFQLMLSLTVAKFLTALVSCATAITLLTLFPLLLKVKVRELFLKQNVLELDQEVGLMKKKKLASLHVRMLTREIRKSLDKHNILYTTLVELSKTLGLYNCAVWMPNEKRTEMNLTHELRSSSENHHYSIPVNDRDVLEIKATKGVRILRSDSTLGNVSSGGCDAEESGAVAAIRMPMLRVSDFKGGTPEFIDTCYAILVLVLPSGSSWSYEAMEILEVVADQVAVALSHAAVLEESQLMREQLSEQNRALQQAKMNAMMASQARNSFQKVMSHGMRRPMHSIIGLLSMFQDDNMSFDQKIVGDTLMKASNVLSTLINDAMEISVKDTGRFPLDMRPFRLHPMIKEASCLAKCLCVYKGLGFEIDVQSSLPDLVVGDERRAFQVILHMFGYLLDLYDHGRGTIIFRVYVESGSGGGGKNDRMVGMWKANAPDGYASIKFEIEIKDESSSNGPMSATQRRLAGPEIKEGLRFNMCKKLVQMMQGNIWVSPNAFGFVKSMNLVLRFQTRQSTGRAAAFAASEQQPNGTPPQFKGLKIVLADDDNVNRTVTKKLLEKLGCDVTAVASGFECLSTLSTENTVKVLILDLQMPEMDGYEVATRIRKFGSRNWPLIIALTASAEDNVWERCLQLGMNGVIRKPVLLQVMADELRRVLQVAGKTK
ncbi:Protein EIN4 [Linum perenne]